MPTTIEFRCPECDKKLRTAADKAGLTAKCPQCGTAVTVPVALPASRDENEPFPSFDDFEAVAPPARPPRQVACPMCGSMNDAAATRCSNCGEDLTARTPDDFARPSASLAFGDIFGTAFELWKNELGMTLVATLVAIALYFVAYLALLVPPTVLMESLGANEDVLITVLSVAFFVVCMGLFVTVAFYLALGMGQIALAVARGRPAQIGAMFSPPVASRRCG